MASYNLNSADSAIVSDSTGGIQCIVLLLHVVKDSIKLFVMKFCFQCVSFCRIPVNVCVCVGVCACTCVGGCGCVKNTPVHGSNKLLITTSSQPFSPP